MTISTQKNGDELTISLGGQLDTGTAPELEKVVSETIGGVKSLIFDFKDLNYITSAGLRVLLVAQKTMNTQGKMKIINTNDDIMDVFEISGFSDIMDIN